MAGNALYYGDNLDVLRRYVKDETVDLVYLDPPFNSNATYSVLFAHADGSRSSAQIKAFEDTWHWDQAAAESFRETVRHGGRVAEALTAFQTLLGPSTMLAYLTMMAPRLAQLHRVLKPTGSIYLHCDPTASHYLKLLMDAVFGPERFENEIVWGYRGGGVSKKRFGRKHDIVLFYSKGDEHYFEPQYTSYSPETLKRVQKKGLRVNRTEIDVSRGAHLQDWWTDFNSLQTYSPERLGYPTQKPEALLNRIVTASCPPGGTVLDPFCGCGTTIAVAERLKRHWIGIDLTALAISLIKSRLTAAGASDYKVFGEPTTADDAVELAKSDPYGFQWWSLGLIGARPAEGKKGADHGIDGRLFFFDDDANSKQVIVSVKAGKVQVSHVRDLVGVLDREKAQIGVLISLNEPTGPMRSEAASGGFYGSRLFGQFPRVQLLTVAELLAGQTIKMPNAGNAQGMTVALPPTPEEVHPGQMTLG